MINKIITSRMQESDITQALKIWGEQYGRHCSSEAYPDHWKKNTREIEEFLKRKVESRTGIVAKLDNSLIGYLTYDEFPFNGEKSVFCPSIAHAAVEEYKEEAYLSLYKSISKEWVDTYIYNHMWTINYNDTKLRDILYDLGFGSYLIDAFTITDNKIYSNSPYEIRRAELQDVEILYSLVEESRQYYHSAPLFLKRDQSSKNEILEIIQKGNVFIAWEDNKAIGFINVSVSKRDNIIDLSVSNSGLIDEIGAYIQPEYRGKALGKELLKNVFDYCNKNDIKSVHVDFETGNLFANKFWRKYFNPMLISVRRTINKNIND
ncbi:MAG TPA: GNAT family N-acetyltransferase [Pseudobacteroides sp.]|uniref:GNAT family N-acetyltransferase n=1 Tax=Pseudobacteroides sp. TaxID=1968840 RepID=UPI002F9527D5